MMHEKQDTELPNVMDQASKVTLFDRIRARLHGPGGQIALDTAITAVVNSALLIVASRTLPSNQLTSLTMVQLFATSVVILQRAILLSPGLAARRSVGQPAAIPFRWSALSVSFLAALAAFIAPVTLTSGEPLWARITLSGCLSASLLLQDYVRYILFSRNKANIAVRMDALCLVVTAIAAVPASLDPSWARLTAVWSLSSLVAVACTLLLWRQHLHTGQSLVKLGATLKLGRWSGLDNLLSVFSNILPMVVTTLALATPLAASYRVLQTGLGPLNIINTTLVAAFGLSSYRLTSREEIQLLSRRVRRSTFFLCLATLSYVTIAFTALSYLANVDFGTAFRVSVILGLAAVLGAATTPPMAAASALGYQVIGVSIRIVVVVLATSMSWRAAAGLSVPWDDPIGVVAVGAAALGAIGWSVGYAVASKREKARFS
jgi:hypothetical protein